MNELILYNAVQTPDGTVLHSKHVHDYIEYKDKNGEIFMVDGGTQYLKRSGKGYKDLTVYDDGKHETRRKYIYWGSVYNKDMTLRDEVLWRPIMDLETSHIENILSVCRLSEFMKEIFEEELKQRDE